MQLIGLKVSAVCWAGKVRHWKLAACGRCAQTIKKGCADIRIIDGHWLWLFLPCGKPMAKCFCWGDDATSEPAPLQGAGSDKQHQAAFWNHFRPVRQECSQRLGTMSQASSSICFVWWFLMCFSYYLSFQWQAVLHQLFNKASQEQIILMHRSEPTDVHTWQFLISFDQLWLFWGSDVVISQVKRCENLKLPETFQSWPFQVLAQVDLKGHRNLEAGKVPSCSMMLGWDSLRGKIALCCFFGLSVSPKLLLLKCNEMWWNVHKAYQCIIKIH